MVKQKILAYAPVFLGSTYLIRMTSAEPNADYYIGVGGGNLVMLECKAGVIRPISSNLEWAGLEYPQQVSAG